MDISPSRLGETEYVLLDPRYVRQLRFGSLYIHPDFPDRYDANQLARVSCRPEEIDEMIEELDQAVVREAAPAGLGFRKVSGYDPTVWGHLEGGLAGLGWEVFKTSMMLHTESGSRAANPDVRVRVVDPWAKDLEALYRVDGVMDRGFELARSQSERVGGEYLVGYLGNRPACCTGWYEVDGVARFRHVYTAPWARGRACATTLIRHVQGHPRVRALDGLVIMVTPDGPQRLYQDLGFRRMATFWEAKLTLE